MEQVDRPTRLEFIQHRFANGRPRVYAYFPNAARLISETVGRFVTVGSRLPLLCSLCAFSIFADGSVTTRACREWSVSNFSCSLTRNITSHSMKNSSFHNNTQMIYDSTTQLSLQHSYRFYLKRLGVCTFWTWEWKGLKLFDFGGLLEVDHSHVIWVDARAIWKLRIGTDASTGQFTTREQKLRKSILSLDTSKVTLKENGAFTQFSRLSLIPSPWRP